MMSKKHNKKIHIGTISAQEQFAWTKPKHNGFSIGTGIHGDTKYNRRKFKKETKEFIQEDAF